MKDGIAKSVISLTADLLRRSIIRAYEPAVPFWNRIKAAGRGRCGCSDHSHDRLRLKETPIGTATRPDVHCSHE